jgi:hypothetical protein
LFLEIGGGVITFFTPYILSNAEFASVASPARSIPSGTAWKGVANGFSPILPENGSRFEWSFLRLLRNLRLTERRGGPSRQRSIVCSPGIEKKCEIPNNTASEYPWSVECSTLIDFRPRKARGIGCCSTTRVRLAVISGTGRSAYPPLRANTLTLATWN